jgi:hypothetical protein
MRFVVSLLALLLAAVPAAAEETRTAPEGHVPPPASLAQLDWLVGIWTGDGIGGARATEVYSPPGAGSIAGHFVQEDGAGGIAFFEFVQIAEVDGSLVYRLKHFSNELVGWEEKERHVAFPLVALEPDAAYFDGLTVRREDDVLISAVRVRQRDGSMHEYVFRYRRVE